MTRKDRRLLLDMALHFSEMSKHLMALDHEFSNPDLNPEQVEAAMQYTFQSRNLLVGDFQLLKPHIDQAINEVTDSEFDKIIPS